jgi:hypothetical protein
MAAAALAALRAQEDEAEFKKLVDETIPAKILHLRGRIASLPLSIQDAAKVKEIFNALADEWDQEAHEFVDTGIRLLGFLNGRIPAVADGNNFGVEVLEMVRKQITEDVSWVWGGFQSNAVVYETVATCATKAAKHPNMGYETALEQRYRARYRQLCTFMLNVSLLYTRVLDLINKNMSKLMTPREEHKGMAMY